MTAHPPPPAPQLSAEDLNRGNPNHDSFWQARGFKKRSRDWKERIANEKAARARQLQKAQKAAAREARLAGPANPSTTALYDYRDDALLVDAVNRLPSPL